MPLLKKRRGIAAPFLPPDLRYVLAERAFSKGVMMSPVL
jgi:hypothetical protein